METSYASTVPEFAAERYNLLDDEGGRDLLKVRCPRCKRVFWVETLWGRSPEVEHKTRPCPYCFKVSWLPGFKPGEQMALEPAPAKRRIVKRKKKPKRA